MSNNYFSRGEWNAICDVCGGKKKASELRKRWDGFMVCNIDWEMRHPQDFIKAPKNEQGIPWARDEPSDQFISVTYGSQGTQANTIPSGTFNTN